MVVDEPPPAQLDPFKIPIKIVERVMNNCYSGDGTVHLGNQLLFIFTIGFELVVKLLTRHISCK
jgi:hypothetical protein